MIQQNPINSTINIEQLKPATDEICEFALSHGFQIDEFMSLVKSSFIDAAKNDGAKTAARISLKTGIDRRQININNKTSLKVPQKTDPILLILRELRIYKSRFNTNLIPIKGSINSFHGLARNFKGRSTMRTIIDELVEIECIEIIDNQTIKIISTTKINVISKNEELMRMGQRVAKLANTIKRNYSGESEKEIEWSIDSSKINSSNKKKLSDHLMQLRKKFTPLMLEFVEEYESNVPEGTYEPYSINIFINNNL